MDAITDFKEAHTDYDIHELLRKRWSPRSYSDESIDPELLRQLFDAARWAPSCYNEQPWRFIVATKEQPEEFEKLSRVLGEFNKKWAPGAPVLGLTVVSDNFDLDSRPNRHAAHDLGQAIAHLTFEATKHDLYVHQMAGIQPEKAVELYHLPDDVTPLTMFTIGYLGDPDELPGDLKKKEQAERTRKPIDEIVFRGSWEDPAQI